MRPPSNVTLPHFRGRAHTHAGAQGIGLLSASVLRSTLEDFLVLAVAGMASYVAVLNLPLKRSEIKAKVGNRANNFVEGVAAAMAEVRWGVGVVRTEWCMSSLWAK